MGCLLTDMDHALAAAASHRGEFEQCELLTDMSRSTRRVLRGLEVLVFHVSSVEMTRDNVPKEARNRSEVMTPAGADPERAEAEEAVLAVLRSCCAEDEIERYARVLIKAPPVVQGMQSGESFRDAVRDALYEAIGALPSAERQAVRIMAGLEAGWEPSALITREDRKSRMGTVLVRSQDVAADGLTARSIEMKERDSLAPAVTALLYRPRQKRKATLRDRPIFAQFINPEFLALHNQGNLLQRPEAAKRRLEYVTRMALLTSRIGLVLPASYLFEVPGVADFMADTREVAEVGAIQLTAPATSLDDYQSIKATEYRDDAVNLYAVGKPSTAAVDVPWRPRHGSSAGQTISNAWSQEVRPGAALSPVVESIVRANGVSYRSAARSLSTVPDRLDGRALVARFVIDAIAVPVPPSGRYAVEWLLSNKYLESYLDDLDAAVLVDFPFGSFAPMIGGSDQRQISAARVERVLKLLGISQAMLHRPVDWQLLLMLRDTFELDVLLPTLYEDNSPSGRWLRAAAFRQRSAPPDVSREPSGYVSWLGDLLTAVA